jgi:hypothetical protein
MLLVACSPYMQHTSKLLLALAVMSTSKANYVIHAFAKQYAVQLLNIVGSNLINSTPQDITNAMWACSELGLAGELLLQQQFLQHQPGCRAVYTRTQLRQQQLVPKHSTGMRL